MTPISEFVSKYQAYDLILASELPCPELVPGQANPDVVIRYGLVPEQLPDPDGEGVLYQASADRFLLKLDGIARYLVQHGSEIVIERAPHATDDEVRLFLLGSCLGALLHQRGVLALHAAAIQTERGAVLFAGPSGKGKSTLLGAFVLRGYRMLSDDVTGLVLDEAQRPTVLPGYPQIKVWTDTAERLGQPTDGLRRVRPKLEKFALPVQASFAGVPTPLHTVYILGTHNEGGANIRLEPLEGRARFAAIRHSTYRQHFLDGLGLRPAHFRLAAAVAHATRMVRVTRPHWPFVLEELFERIEEDMG